MASSFEADSFFAGNSGLGVRHITLYPADATFLMTSTVSSPISGVMNATTDLAGTTALTIV